MNKIYGFLKSQKTGIIVGFTVTGLLIIGSLIMNYFPESYEGLSGEDITFFFNNPKPIHAWFYIMFVAFAMYGICIFICTLDSILRKVKARSKKIPLYGASIVHIGFLITLVAHLIGGIWSESGRPLTIADTWVKSGEYELKVTGLDSTTYPNGMPKRITAQMKIRKDGKEFDDTLGYNNPVLLDSGTKAFLLRNYGDMPSSVVLNIDGETMSLNIKDVVEINGSRVLLANLYLPPQFPVPVILLVSKGKGDEYDKTFVRIGRQNAQNIKGVDVIFEDLKSTPAVVVSTKINPSIPLTLIAIGCFGSGMLLVIFRTAYKMVRV
ncbi:MAG: cytochrome c biogenesis protein ResB [Candidatus Brocadiaceae bacterium]|nr:cytochrome c biogenesis protein ResB [Candidatus Brocadiaceae bacterium]